MAISRFDEGTLSGSLVAYWSATESTIGKTGNTVNTVTSVYGNDHPIDLTNPNTGSAEIEHGLTAVGAMPSFQDQLAASQAKLKATITGINTGSSGMSIVLVEKRFTNTQGGYSTSATLTGSATPRCGWTRNSSGNIYRFMALRGSYDTATGIDTNVNKIGLFYDETANSGIGRINDTETSMTHGTQADLLEDVYFFGSGGTATDGMRGYISLMAVYNKKLDATERQDVFDLMQYWVTNNEAPSSGPPTTVTFGPVATNDDPSVTSWSWEASADGGTNWDEAENVLSNVSGEATTSLVVNSATLAENGYQVRCRAISAKEPAGVESAVATLTVQAAS